jgi:Ca-activated chloride channel family protein
VRVEEFVNAFDYGDRPPRRGDFALTLAGAPTPYAESDRYVLLRFGLVAREVSRRERPPAVLIFTVDVSGSMAQGNRLELVKNSLALLLDELEPEDEVGLVVYGSHGQVVLEPTRDRRAIERAIARLVPEGSTNAEEGLLLAYDQASRNLRRGAIHRVILCSDGVANVGRTGPESILERIEREAARGIELTTVGFGMGNYNDRLMEQLADRGDGRYAYVDTLEEARRIFVEELAGTLQTVARDAKVQVEFDPGTVERYRLLGYENRDVADRDFRNDRVDAGEIGAGHGVTALYEVKLAEEAAAGERIAILRLRYRSAVTDQVVEAAEELSVADLANSWEAAPDSLRLAATVAEFAELLKGSYWAKEGDLGLVLREAHRLERETSSEEAAELVALAEKALALRDSSPEPDPLERQ